MTRQKFIFIFQRINGTYWTREYYVTEENTSHLRGLAALNSC